MNKKPITHLGLLKNYFNFVKHCVNSSSTFSIVKERTFRKLNNLQENMQETIDFKFNSLPQLID